MVFSAIALAFAFNAGLTMKGGPIVGLGFKSHITLSNLALDTLKMARKTTTMVNSIIVRGDMTSTSPDPVRRVDFTLNLYSCPKSIPTGVEGCDFIRDVLVSPSVDLKQGETQPFVSSFTLSSSELPVKHRIGWTTKVRRVYVR